MARFELIEENAELMTETQNEIAKEAQKQIKAEMEKMLKNAFKGNKNIKFRYGLVWILVMVLLFSLCVYQGMLLGKL